MSVKNVDEQGRLRSYTTAFRMSPQEHDELNKRVALSGLTKQDYMIKRALEKEIVVVGNMRTFRALRDRLDEFTALLGGCIEFGKQLDIVTIEALEQVVYILNGLNSRENDFENNS